MLAGVVLGVGACAKEVTPYVLFALVVLELLRCVDAPRRRRRGAGAPLAGRALIRSSDRASVFLALLAVLDQIAPPYDPQTGKLVAGGSVRRARHILSYAAHQTSPHGPQGIASYPWDWLVDYQADHLPADQPGAPDRRL